MRFNSKLILSLLVTIPSTLAAVNGKCTGRNGICISTANCSKYGGKSFTGKCPSDPNDIKCCDNITCKANDGRSGSCVFSNQCNTSTHELISGKCPGGSDFKCCVQKPTNTKCSYDGLNGECKNVSSCNGFRVAGLCPGSDNIQCCLPKNTCQDGKLNGQCIPTSQCNTSTHHFVSGKCSGGSSIKCCLPGKTECTTPNHSTIAAAAVAYAWETKNKGKSNNGTQLYRAVKDAIFPNDPYYQSCDRGVATAVVWSGADDSFPVGDTGTQDRYLQSHSNLWTFIGTYDNNYSKLKPGDIVITTRERRGTNHGHIVLYVGNAEVRKKYPNSDAEFVSASYQDRSPGCGDHPSAYKGSGYHIYRYKGNYSGNKKNSYNGCASGTS
jgi:hypothetical protein